MEFFFYLKIKNYFFLKSNSVNITKMPGGFEFMISGSQAQYFIH